MTKKSVDIEKLLVWAIRDELPKKQLSAAEGIWDRIEDYGQRGGIDPGHGAAQRYAHFGLPHPDAETVGQAINRLKDDVIDWGKSIGPLAGDLAGLVTINDLERKPAQVRTPKVGWGAAGTRALKGMFGPNGAQLQHDRPRDVLMVQSFRTSVLVMSHALRASRPDYWPEDPKPYQVPADKGRNAKVIGTCEAKNRYSLGSFCPLRWEPLPVSVITARAEYAVWWEALTGLAETLELKDHIALPPRAPAAPWFGDTDEGEVIVVPPEGPIVHLPLAPSRGRMLAPFRRPPASPVRYPLEAKGDQ